jgi:hypothetical protein
MIDLLAAVETYGYQSDGKHTSRTSVSKTNCVHWSQLELELVAGRL